MVAVRAPPVAAAVASEWTFVWGDGDASGQVGAARRRPSPPPATAASPAAGWLAGCGRVCGLPLAAVVILGPVFGVESTTAQDFSKKKPVAWANKSAADISFIFASRDDVFLLAKLSCGDVSS